MAAPFHHRPWTTQAGTVAVYVLLGLAVVVTLAALAIVVRHWPLAGVVLIAFALGGAVGAFLGDRARTVYRDIAYWSGERMDAWRAADTAADLDQAGPIRPERPRGR
jgi:hypothetical protein